MSYDFLVWKDSHPLTYLELQRLYTQLCDEEDVPLAPAPGLDACLATLKQRVLPGEDKAAAIQLGGVRYFRPLRDSSLLI